MQYASPNTATAIDAPDLDVALELAVGASKHCHRKVEVRPFLRA
ncbi:MAG TPA: hypothetical protein VEX15_01200 [Nocardioidaceae bacterium]|nr:hypothetical protein [Nocardioidaceae bacterium]